MLSQMKKMIYMMLIITQIIILGSIFWIRYKFGNPSFEQILFHIMYEAGINNFDHTYVKSYVKLVILPISILLIILLSFYNKIKKYNLKLFLSTFLINIFIAFVFFGGYTGFEGYVAENEDRNFNFSKILVPNKVNYFRDNYKNPNTLSLKPINKKNIIIIYIESFENGYSDTTLFGENLLSNFTIENSLSVSNFAQAPGAEWTIAGIVASQCGVPLKVVFMHDGNNQGGDGNNGFVKNATCISDVLSKFGYINVFMNGSPLSFAGLELFLKTHKYDERYGKEFWLSSKKYSIDDMNFWGLQDDDLFKEAKLKLEELISQPKPFNLTILTINTHGPDGFLSKSCIKSGGKNYSDVVKCTALEMSNFIKYVKTRGYDKTTNIVILGDHMSMPTPLEYKLASQNNRSIFNSFVSRQNLSANRNDILHFDFAPTILDLAGVEVVGGRFGLGYNIFGTLSSDIPDSRLKDMKRNLLNVSTDYMNLWSNN